MKIIAECDCCTSDLLLINDTDFIIGSYCLEADGFFGGSYQVVNNKLVLTFKPRILAVEYSIGDSTLPKQEYKFEDKQLEKAEVEITEFKNKILLNLGGQIGVEVNNKGKSTNGYVI